MQTVILHRTVLILVLGVALLAPASALAAPSAPELSAARPGFIQDLWAWLTTFWSGAGADIDPYGVRSGGHLVPLWADEGAEIDPYGNRSATPAPPPAPDNGDAGAEIDPYGGR